MKNFAFALLPAVLCLTGCDCGARTHSPTDAPCVGDACNEPCDGADCLQCDDDPLAAGCPCGPEDEPAPCYSGATETAGVGPCRVGLRSCRDGAWTTCEDEILPVDETCDELDNDCDGTVDDGVLGACGDCSPDCAELAWGDGADETPFAPDETNSIGVALRDPGALVLEGDELALRVLWVANSPEGTVSLIDTGLRTERGRYRTGPDALRDDPSRTSVGYEGHAYIANRASYGAGVGQGAVTKILEHDCPDRDGDGTVETSRGGSDVLGWGEDECVEWRTPIDGAVRAVAAQVKQEGAGIHEVVWAGTTYEKRFQELDAETGEPTGLELTFPNCQIYGAALAPDGQMWVSCMFSGGYARFDTYDPADFEESNEASPYGLAVGPDGRVWFSDGHVYDPTTQVVTSVPGLGWSAGVATDATGSAWFGSCGGTAHTCRVDGDTMAVESFSMSSRGIAVDFDGFVWGVPQSPGSLTVMDPATREFETVLDDCDGGPCLVAPYTYSDMTGTQLRAVMTPFGSWETIVEGCGPDELTHWVRVGWEAEIADDTSLRIQVRAADELAALAAQPWVDVATDPPDDSPASIADVLGDRQGSQLLGVRVVLATAAHGNTPVVHRVSVQRGCGAVFR